MNTPEELIHKGMKTMSESQLNQFFRKLAKQLHPDKNNHPLAKEAFQRV